MDRLLLKRHRPEPFVVLTAPFGGSTSPTAPYSTRSGEMAPGHAYPTNTWRNNFGIQKGIGRPAEPEVIRRNLDDPAVRLACPHPRGSGRWIRMRDRKRVVPGRGALDLAAEDPGRVAGRRSRQPTHLRAIPPTGRRSDSDLPLDRGSLLRSRPRCLSRPRNGWDSGVRCRLRLHEAAGRGAVRLRSHEYAERWTYSRGAAAPSVLGRPTPETPEAPEVEAPPIPEPPDQQPAGPLPELMEPALRNSGVEAELDVAEDLAEARMEKVSTSGAPDRRRV